MSLLEIRDVTLRFGGLTALDGVSFEVEPGEVFSIVGPNGAGKSTLFNLVSRFYDPETGDVRFADRSILDRTASEVAGLYCRICWSPATQTGDHRSCRRSCLHRPCAGGRSRIAERSRK